MFKIYNWEILDDQSSHVKLFIYKSVSKKLIMHSSIACTKLNSCLSTIQDYQKKMRLRLQKDPKSCECVKTVRPFYLAWHRRQKKQQHGHLLRCNFLSSFNLIKNPTLIYAIAPFNGSPCLLRTYRVNHITLHKRLIYLSILGL